MYHWKKILKNYDKREPFNLYELKEKYSNVFMAVSFIVSLIFAIITSLLLYANITFSIVVFWAIYLPGAIFGILSGESIVILKMALNGFDESNASNN
jgi:VIT1/CCC1 family predicted Fe2+/Mn2+ transporter